MKALALLSCIFAVGAAEARVTVYRNQDVLVKTLFSPALTRVLGTTTVNALGDTFKLNNADLVEATVEKQPGSATTVYAQRLVYEAKSDAGRTYQCTLPVSTPYAVKTSPQGITYSEIGEPSVGAIRCR